MLGHILSIVRGDFWILANRVLRKAGELDRIILPVSFYETKVAVSQNTETRKTALDYLARRGAIGVFPGGTRVDREAAAGPADGSRLAGLHRAYDREKRSDDGGIFFEDANSRLFQLAGHLHCMLRLALVIKEFRARVDEPVRVVIGRPVSADDLAARREDPRAMMDFLSAETYALSPEPLSSTEYGFEFDYRYRT